MLHLRTVSKKLGPIYILL